jgi:hypothetical protein
MSHAAHVGPFPSHQTEQLDGRGRIEIFCNFIGCNWRNLNIGTKIENSCKHQGGRLQFSLFLSSFFFWDNLVFIITFGYLLLCFPKPSKIVRGSNFYFSRLFLLLCLPFVPLWQKRGVIFIFGPGMYFPNRSSDFCPRMAKGGVC